MRTVFSIIAIATVFFSCVFCVSNEEKTIAFSVHNPIDSLTIDSVPENVKRLMKAYPQIIKFEKNRLYFKNGSNLLFDDSLKNKTQEQLLSNPDIEDQFFYVYNKGLIPEKIEKNADPGRIRNEAFFKAIYGKTKSEVQKNLVEIVWLPKNVNQKIKVTSINGVDKKLKKISDELDQLPVLKKYLTNIGGTFTWRNISGTNRLSMHSFGMTIDINVAFSNYWQWDCKCTNESTLLPYKNKIPQEIITIFEKHGFIWGGKWYHYDSMHFEYRPELINE